MDSNDEGKTYLQAGLDNEKELLLIERVAIWLYVYRSYRKERWYHEEEPEYIKDYYRADAKKFLQYLREKPEAINRDPLLRYINGGD